MSRHFSEFADRLSAFIARCFRTGTCASPALDETESTFNRLARELFGLQFAHNSVYRRFCEARGVTPDRIVHWFEIPACPTSAFKEFDITCLPPAERKLVFHSSGTTQKNRSRHYHSPESVAVYEASLLTWFRRHFLGEAAVPPHPALSLGEREIGAASQEWGKIPILSLTPPPSSAPNSSLVHMFATIQRHCGSAPKAFGGVIGADGEWELDFKVIDAFLASVKGEPDPVIIAGTAFNFVQLIDRLSQNGIRRCLPLGSRILETGGYKGRTRSIPKTELYALISQGLGVEPSNIISEYGMSELSSQAYDRTFRGADARRSYRFPPWVRVQIISPEDGQPVSIGQTGLIRVFDLANVWSAMAIQTEDLGMEIGEGGFELIGRNVEAEPRGCSLMTA